MVVAFSQDLKTQLEYLARSVSGHVPEDQTSWLLHKHCRGVLVCTCKYLGNG